MAKYSSGSSFTTKKTLSGSTTGGTIYTTTGAKGDSGGTGGGGGGGGSSDPGDILAAITNEDFAIYEDDFLPVEEDLIAEVTDPASGNNAASQALQDALAGFDRQKSVADRGLGRTGTSVTVGQQSKLDSARGLARSTTGVGAANLARRNQNADNDATITNLVQAGQSLRGVALQGLGAAANMSSQRDAQGRANDAQAQAGFLSNVGTGAGVGFAVGGPVGAGIGAGVGALVSLF